MDKELKYVSGDFYSWIKFLILFNAATGFWRANIIFRGILDGFVVL
jgi:hypothetical protein